MALVAPLLLMLAQARCRHQQQLLRLLWQQ
jgi:hypothetical protein